MRMYATVELAAIAADAGAARTGAVWVVHSVANEARTRLRYVAVSAEVGWRLPVHYRTTGEARS